MENSIVHTLHAIFDVLAQTATPTGTAGPSNTIPGNLAPWVTLVTGVLGIITTVGAWIVGHRTGLRERLGYPRVDVSQEVHCRTEGTKRILTVRHITKNSGAVLVRIPYVLFRIQRMSPLDEGTLVVDEDTGTILYPLIYQRKFDSEALLEGGSDEPDRAVQEFILPDDLTLVRIYTWVPNVTTKDLGWWFISEFDLTQNKIVQYDSSDGSPAPANSGK